MFIRRRRTGTRLKDPADVSTRSSPALDIRETFMKNRFAWVALTAVSFALLTTIPLWWPRLRLHAVSQQLRNIKSDSEAMALVSELLQSDTDYGLSVVAGYASHSSLRSLHRRHRIFLMHDASSGKIHYTLAAPEGTFEIPAALEISDQQRKDLERAATETIGRTTTITCFWDAHIVFSVFN